MTTHPHSPFRLFLDIQATQTLEHPRRGIPRYVAEHSAALLRHPDAVSGLGLNPLLPFPEELHPQLADSPQVGWSTATGFRKAQAAGPVAYHIMSPFELSVPSNSLLPPFAAKDDIPLVVTLYDLIPLLRAGEYLKDPNLSRVYSTRLELIRQADLVLTISANTSRDAMELLSLDPDRVAQIGSGVSDYFRPAAPGEAPLEYLRRQLPALQKPFVLSVAGAEKRKNVEGLIEAYGSLPKPLRRDLQLVIACQLNDEYRKLWASQAQTSGLADGELVLTDLISDSVLLALYQAARLFIFPSTYEGFGLPLAEAAACGCPALTSNTSALPEVLDYAPATFDPADHAEMAGLMERALTDGSFRKDLKAAAGRAASKHTWQSVAQETLTALEKLEPPPAIPGSGFSPPRRLRIALVGPFPPTRSGIADYNFRLAGSLAGLCDLDLLAPGLVQPGVAEIPETRRFPIAALGTHLNPYSYDALVYTVGNSPHHHATYEMACRFPGVVWFHDVRLSGLYISYAASHDVPGGFHAFMRQKLEACYRSRVPAELLADPPANIDAFNDFELGMTAEFAQSARGVIVNSQYAERLLVLDQGPFKDLPPLSVVPLAAPHWSPDESLNGTVDWPVPIIGSFGIGARHKAPDMVIEALAILRKKVAAKLVFIGPADSNIRELIALHAKRAGVQDEIEFTGDLTQDEYRAWLSRVACAVQVRRLSHGESSAAINDCLAAGIPVISNLPSCAELPEGTVDFLGPGASPEDIAAHLERLLSDPSVRRAFSESGRRYARSRTFDRVAAELTRFVSSLQLQSQV